jgi:hypothetical protein
MFELYEEPGESPLGLALRPRLDAPGRRDHPDQSALGEYLDHVEAVLAPRLEAHRDRDGELALRLQVGVSEGEPLMGGGDLDSYLLPVVRRLGPSRFASAWAVEQHGSSNVCVEPARSLAPQQLTGWHFSAVGTAASSESTAWKQQIAAQIESLAPVSDATELQLCFRVGSETDWPALWRPAIAALGAILGVDDPDEPFNPRDDRVVRLGLHRNVDASLGDVVEIGVAWRPASLTRS